MKRLLISFIIFNSVFCLFSQNFKMENVSTSGYNDPFFTFNLWPDEEYSFSSFQEELKISYGKFSIEKEGPFSYFVLTEKIPDFIIENNSENKILVLSGMIKNKINEKTSFLSSYTICYNPDFENEIMSVSFLQNKEYRYSNQTSSYIEGGKEYSINNLSSLNLATPWIEGVSNYGIGEGFIVDYKYKNENYLLIMNGYISFDKPYLYEQNSRVKQIRITGLESNKSEILTVLDTPHPQTVDISFLDDTEGFSVEIVDIYKGKKYADTCIQYLVPYEYEIIPFDSSKN